MKLGRWAATTDTGHRRRRNEDSYVARPPLFGVADGMGGAQAGEVASRLAAGVLTESGEGGSGEERLTQLIQEANRRVYRRSNEDKAAEGMGTTMTVALVDDEHGTIAFGHVGDSRAYRLRDGELEQLTEDHSLVQELLRSGRLSPEEAHGHPQRSVITRAVGTEPDVDVDTMTVDARPGDLYLICSDGLTDMVEADEIREALEQGRDDLEHAIRLLVEAAKRGGGIDNITVVLFEMAGAEDGDGRADTRTLPAVEERAADDEDTLDELDAVPPVDTAVLSAADVDRELAAQEGRASRAPRRHGAGDGSRWPAMLALVLALALIAALVVWGIAR